MRVTPILLAVILAGCGKAEPEPSKPEPGKSQPNKPPKPAPTRRLDLDAIREIESTFNRNPVAAREQYRDVRWTFYASPFEFGILDVVTVHVVPEQNSRTDGNEAYVAKMVMKNARETSKLQRDVTSMCEGYLEDWDRRGLQLISVVVK